MNTLITRNEVDSVIKTFLTNKSTGLNGFTGESYQIPILLRPLTKKILRRGNASKLILQDQHYSNTKANKDTTIKQNYRPTSLMNTDAKMLNKIPANQIQQYIKRIIHHDQLGFTL